jgi:uncharacterized protein YndB with AHSA1/START domain
MKIPHGAFERYLLFYRYYFKEQRKMKELKIMKSITLNADVAKVWEALTTPEMIKRYTLGTEVVSNWKVGSPILWIKTLEEEEIISEKGSIERIEVGKLLQFTSFDLNTKYSDVPSNYIQATYELTPKLGKTVLSVTQGDYSRVEDGIKRFTDADGGLDQTLNALKTLVEKKL